MSKVPILKEVNFGKMQLCRVEHICPHFWAWLLNTIAITPKSEDKYVEKVFNSTELHFSKVTSFKIGTLVYIYWRHSKIPLELLKGFGIVVEHWKTTTTVLGWFFQCHLLFPTFFLLLSFCIRYYGFLLTFYLSR